LSKDALTFSAAPQEESDYSKHEKHDSQGGKDGRHDHRRSIRAVGAARGPHHRQEHTSAQQEAKGHRNSPKLSRYEANILISPHRCGRGVITIFLRTLT